MNALLTQTQLMDRLRSEGLPLGHDTIQACIRVSSEVLDYAKLRRIFADF